MGRNVTAVMGLGVIPSVISKPALMPRPGRKGHPSYQPTNKMMKEGNQGSL